MKKSVFLMGIIAVIFGLGAYYYKILYPPLPIQSITQKEALAIVKEESDNLIKMTEEDGFEWYISELGKNEVIHEVKKLLGKYGCEFQKKNDSELFFKKGEKPLIITIEPWSKNYVLAKVPVGWKQ